MYNFNQTITRIRISIENVPIELPDKKVKTFLLEYTTVAGKTYYPGIKHENKYFITATRVYQCIKLLQHIPIQIYKFVRYLRIRYDSQPKSNPTISNNNNPNIENTHTPTNHHTPTIINNI